jgi:hypothetical protein
MKILDATCGYKGMWYQKNHPYVTFMDKRKEEFQSAHLHQKKRTYRINPDVVSEWKNAPFPDEYFDVVLFDPPHIIWSKPHIEGTIEKENGHLDAGDWEQVLQEGITKLFSILKSDGIFILKWCEVKIPVKKIIEMCPYNPLFGTRTGQANKTHWIVFIKEKHSQKG